MRLLGLTPIERRTHICIYDKVNNEKETPEAANRQASGGRALLQSLSQRLGCARTTKTNKQTQSSTRSKENDRFNHRTLWFRARETILRRDQRLILQRSSSKQPNNNKKTIAESRNVGPTNRRHLRATQIERGDRLLARIGVIFGPLRRPRLLQHLQVANEAQRYGDERDDFPRRILMYVTGISSARRARSR
jgi:hypothetical protein